MPDLKRTPLYDLHVELGARMVPFAGWEMPVQYPLGVMKEHQHCRAAAGLFDVSHMGQVILRADSVDAAAIALERLVPADVAGLKEGRQRYGLFTEGSGGILDDLMIARKADHLFLVVNAAMAEDDIAHLQAGLPDCRIEPVRGSRPCRAAGAGRGGSFGCGHGCFGPPVHGQLGGTVGIRHAVDQPLGVFRRGRVRDIGCG